LSDNSPRIVSARPPLKLRAAILAKSPDTRRNLYVLGLPFDLSLWVSLFVIMNFFQRQSRTELSSIFSHFGIVTHSVILATVDNASRRRGFVVMSTHAEAKVAMDNISQTNIRCVTATA
jgi:RNA recognition motif-containing protein